MIRLVRVLLVLGVLSGLGGAVMAASVGTPGALPVAPIEKGFGGVAWGSDPAKAAGFVKLKTLEGVDYFVNLRERVELKGFAKPTVYYGAMGGRLYAVHLRLKEASAYAALKSRLSAVYGPGRQAREGEIRVIRWKAGTLLVKLKGEPEGQTKLSLYYRPVAAILPVYLRELEPGSDLDILRQTPQEGAQDVLPLGQPQEKPGEPKVVIDVISILKKGHN